MSQPVPSSSPADSQILYQRAQRLRLRNPHITYTLASDLEPGVGRGRSIGDTLVHYFVMPIRLAFVPAGLVYHICKSHLFHDSGSRTCPADSKICL